MRRLFLVLVVLAVCVVGFGFYRGWFTVSSSTAPAGSNDVNVNLTTDKDKMRQDVQTVKDKAAEFTGSVTEGPAEPDNGGQDNTAPDNP